MFLNMAANIKLRPNSHSLQLKEFYFFSKKVLNYFNEFKWLLTLQIFNYETNHCVYQILKLKKKNLIKIYFYLKKIYSIYLTLNKVNNLFQKFH